MYIVKGESHYRLTTTGPPKPAPAPAPKTNAHTHTAHNNNAMFGCGARACVRCERPRATPSKCARVRGCACVCAWWCEFRPAQPDLLRLHCARPPAYTQPDYYRSLERAARVDQPEVHGHNNTPRMSARRARRGIYARISECARMCCATFGANRLGLGMCVCGRGGDDANTMFT